MGTLKHRQYSIHHSHSSSDDIARGSTDLGRRRIQQHYRFTYLRFYCPYRASTTGLIRSDEFFDESLKPYLMLYEYGYPEWVVRDK
eukprot:3669315-Pleurochrysis_carterae.AAC.1